MSARPTRLALPLVLAVACAPDVVDSSAEVEVEVTPPALSVPAGPLEIRITGDDYRWILRYPGVDGALDTPDDVVTRRHLHLPARREVVLDLTSNDYVYTLFVPYLDILESAVPDLPFELELDTGPAGTHDLLGSQMCGYTHPELLGDVVIEVAADFEAWLAAQAE